MAGMYRWLTSVLEASRWSGAVSAFTRFALTCGLVLVGGYLIVRFGRRLIARSLKPVEGGRLITNNRRLQTVQALANSVLRYSVFFIGALMVLDAAGVPVTSLVASAGLVGLAVGFGAQNLVRDVITGFFILLEDQYGIGDYVALAAVEGIVENVGLRTTKVRDFNGDLYIIPNGSIGQVTNKSRGQRRALIRVQVPYETDLAEVEQVLDQVMKKAGQELPEIESGPSVIGVTDVSESLVTYTIVARTQAMSEWAVERELRRRCKQGFDQAGIMAPYPRQVQLVQMSGHPVDEAQPRL